MRLLTHTHTYTQWQFYDILLVIKQCTQSEQAYHSEPITLICKLLLVTLLTLSISSVLRLTHSATSLWSVASLVHILYSIMHPLTLPPSAYRLQYFTYTLIAQC